MRYVREMALILTMSFLGEMARRAIPLPVPGSIYGLVFMYIALMTGVVKLESVKAVSSMLLAVMPLMFIPAAAGLIELGGVIAPMLGETFVVIVLATAAVMSASGFAAAWVIRRGKR